MKTGIKAFCNKHYQAFDTGEGCLDCEQLNISSLLVDPNTKLVDSYIKGNTLYLTYDYYTPMPFIKRLKLEYPTK